MHDNLSVEDETFADIDKLENLPSREPTHRHRAPEKDCACSQCQERRGDNYPYHRVERWLKSRIGKRWDCIISEFVHANWIPAEHRSYKKLSQHVESHTFMRDGEVWFHTQYRSHNNAVKVSSEYGEVFYVDPRTNSLCYKKKIPRTHWAMKRKEKERKTMRVLGDYHQLLRINGIWYEVRGVPEGMSFNAHKYGPKVRMMWDKPDKRDVTYMRHCRERPRIVLKRQLSGQDLQFYKLRNEIDSVIKKF